ncbi:MAG: bifunctional oligoribonuclease/PAP phosphatase NrnA [Eubacteriales bacterium]|nr:bifunctional oligoribonuclease/PAP phosphatase NrnA [Eubacteriales bacterium]
MKRISELINKADTIAILGHISEDADSVGSSLAMKCVIENFGKKADVIFSEPLEKRLEFMKADGIVYDGSECKYDLCICLDCADSDRLGERKKIFDAAKKTLLIDHHITNKGFADANYIVPDSSATGEILYDVFGEIGAVIDTKTAEYLFIAIASDTGSFKYSNVSPKTMRITAELLEKGIDNAYLSRMLFDTETRDAMHFKGMLMSKVETYFDTKLSLISVSNEEFENSGVDEKDMGDIVNIPRMVQNTEIAVSIRETKDKIKISFRSNGKYDVGSLAQSFGGGGHTMASGASVSDMSFEETKEKVIKVCGELFND